MYPILRFLKDMVFFFKPIKESKNKMLTVIITAIISGWWGWVILIFFFILFGIL